MNFTMIVWLIGGLGLFLYGMAVMSEGLQHVAGDSLRNFLRTLTKNRFTGVLTGLVVTSIIQSSSATTVMLVGFVNAGMLDLTQAIGVIMGANIGTTMTGWLVALLGFKIDIATLALPAIGIGFFIRFAGKQKLTDWGIFLLGFGLLFLGLTLMKDSAIELRKSEAIMNALAAVHVTGIFTYLVVVAIGTILTIVIQSSSATMALTMTIAQQGMIDFPTAAALILGENIGTTITANIAAIGTSPAAKRAARAHFLFNVIGVLWMMAAFDGFISLINMIVPGDVLSADLSARTGSIPDHMAAFHTGFNIINTLLFLPFVNVLANLTRRLVKDPVTEKKLKRSPLKFIQADLMPTPGLEMDEAKKSLAYMGERCLKGLDILKDLISNPSDPDFEKKSAKILSIEDELDTIEEEINDFIVHVSQQHITPEIGQEINKVTGSAHDFERIGDHLRNILGMIERKQEKSMNFSETAVEHLKDMIKDVSSIVKVVTLGILHPRKEMLTEAFEIENGIDKKRKAMRADHVKRLTEGACEPRTGIVYVELLTSFEKIGDHAFNIAQDFSPVKFPIDE